MGDDSHFDSLGVRHCTNVYDVLKGLTIPQLINFEHIELYFEPILFKAISRKKGL